MSGTLPMEGARMPPNAVNVRIILNLFVFGHHGIQPHY